MAKYKVTQKFTDLQDGNFKYSVGDEYPRTGLKVNQKRIDSLLNGKNKRGVPVIKEVREALKTPEEPSPVPEKTPADEKTYVSRAKATEATEKPKRSRKNYAKSDT